MSWLLNELGDSRNPRPFQRLSAEDDLFAELLGGLSKPFEIIRKKNYDYAVLEDGIANSISDFKAAIRDALAAGSPMKDSVELSSLRRPLIVQAKSLESEKKEVAAMLIEIQKEVQKQGRGFVVFPAHDTLASLVGSLARDLRSALKLTGLVPPLSIDSEITESFCRATRELFEIQLKTAVRFVGAAARAPGVIHEACHSGSIDLEGGSVSVSALVTVSEKCIPELMKRMTGLPQIPEELLRNGPAEFANIVGGAVRGQLNAGGYSLRAPTIPKIYGPERQHVLAAADSSTAVEIRLETELGDAFLEIRFFS